jgi:hypothetical protein
MVKRAGKWMVGFSLAKARIALGDREVDAGQILPPLLGRANGGFLK